MQIKTIQDYNQYVKTNIKDFLKNSKKSEFVSFTESIFKMVCYTTNKKYIDKVYNLRLRYLVDPKIIMEIVYERLMLDFYDNNSNYKKNSDNYQQYIENISQVLMQLILANFNNYKMSYRSNIELMPLTLEFRNVFTILQDINDKYFLPNADNSFKLKTLNTLFESILSKLESIISLIVIDQCGEGILIWRSLLESILVFDIIIDNNESFAINYLQFLELHNLNENVLITEEKRQELELQYEKLTSELNIKNKHNRINYGWLSSAKGFDSTHEFNFKNGVFKLSKLDESLYKDYSLASVMIHSSTYMKGIDKDGKYTFLVERLLMLVIIVRNSIVKQTGNDYFKNADAMTLIDSSIDRMDILVQKIITFLNTKNSKHLLNL